MLTEWIRHPITQGMLNLIKERLQADKDYMQGLIMNCSFNDPKTQENLTQLKGQIFAYEAVLETKEFLLELTEDGVKSNEAQSSWS